MLGYLQFIAVINFKSTVWNFQNLFQPNDQRFIWVFVASEPVSNGFLGFKIILVSSVGSLREHPSTVGLEETRRFLHARGARQKRSVW